ncbi:hypothetical protein ABMA28_003623 [Loxostege sticticalis]|uniref:Lipase n=1 Tax=Loxostege sticticalis TaxID=481309 RepID=A0ABD0SWM8_LOXSC
MDAVTFNLFIFCGIFCALIREACTYSPQAIAAAGYPVERHKTTTADGYILQIFRIPAGRRLARRSESTNTKGKRAVVLFHGLTGYSGNFIVMGPKDSLGYILADAGYDVWLANLRGTVYSAHHNLTRNDVAFWEFSFEEHGKYDAPAIIDKILSVTGLSKVFYIGYSMGTTTFFTMLSQRPEYNKKLVAFIAMAPAVYMDNIRGLANFALSIDLFPILRQRGIEALAMSPDMLSYIVATFCNEQQPQADICTRLTYALVGEDYEQRRWNMITVFLTTLQPASFRQLEHFGKIGITGVFTSWEDGVRGRVKPYNLTNVRVPVTLLYGENDQLTEKSQVMRLAEDLKSTGVLEAASACPWPKFNHLDFIFAKDVGGLVSRPVAKLVDQLYSKYY